ncbi:hypothetical protein DL93DRAFT_2169493 [Clavulina sp. PMI_390]|nr:hypothetical protein DL93DRAFT_2169493 [Clavulina sp. PMI_390]
MKFFASLNIIAFVALVAQSSIAASTPELSERSAGLESRCCLATWSCSCTEIPKACTADQIAAGCTTTHCTGILC